MPNYCNIYHDEELGKKIRKRSYFYYVVPTGEDEGFVCFSWYKAERAAKELIHKGYESVEIKELIPLPNEQQTT